MADIDDVFDKCNDILDKVADNKEAIASLSTQIENLEMVHYYVCSLCQGVGTITPDGSGGQPPGDPVTCPRCNGTGKEKSGSSVEKD